MNKNLRAVKAILEGELEKIDAVAISTGKELQGVGNTLITLYNKQDSVRSILTGGRPYELDYPNSIRKNPRGGQPVKESTTVLSEDEKKRFKKELEVIETEIAAVQEEQAALQKEANLVYLAQSHISKMLAYTIMSGEMIICMRGENNDPSNF